MLKWAQLAGSFFGQKNQLVRRAGWALQNWVGWEIIEDRLRVAAHYESSYHPYDERIEDTRRTACIGFLSRSFVRFCALMPHLGTQATEGVAEAEAPGTIGDENQFGDEQMADERKQIRTNFHTNTDACSCDSFDQGCKGCKAKGV